MRFFLCIVSWAAATCAWGQIPDAWQFALNTGATSYIGASNGPRSSGAFLTSAVARRDLSSHLRAESGFSTGAFGLTSAPFNRYQEQLTGGYIGFQWHANWSQTRRINPHFGFGISKFQQALFADLLDANGVPYHVWSDGELYDMAENAPYANLYAQTVLPDFQTETLVSTSQVWGLPIRVGVEWQLSDQFNLEAANAWMMGMTPALLAEPAEAMTSFTVGLGWRPGGKLFQDPRIPASFLARNADSDGDGIPDRKDQCFNTPVPAQVDACGCPRDSDLDGVPDFLDEQANSQGPVDARGVEVSAFDPVLSIPAPSRLEFRQIIAEPATGIRPHLPVGQALSSPPTQSVENP